MKTMLALGLLFGSLIGLGGCQSDKISTNDMNNVRSEMSTENYEEAMRKAGRGDELEQQKAEAERRRSDEGAGNF